MRAPTIATLVSLLALAACGQDQPRGDPLGGGAPPAPMTANPSDPAGLPAGHPPVMPAGHPPMDAPTQPAGPIRGGTMLEWTPPEGWTAGKPSNAMRLAQFDLPAKSADGSAVQCIVFSQMGGGVTGNLDRWKGMLASQTAEPKVTNLEANGLKISRIELHGTYADAMTKKDHADAIFLGAVVDTGEGEQVFTIKLVGPGEVVKAEMPKFDAFLASLRTKK